MTVTIKEPDLTSGYMVTNSVIRIRPEHLNFRFAPTIEKTVITTKLSIPDYPDVGKTLHEIQVLNGWMSLAIGVLFVMVLIMRISK